MTKRKAPCELQKQDAFGISVCQITCFMTMTKVTIHKPDHHLIYRYQKTCFLASWHDSAEKKIHMQGNVSFLRFLLLKSNKTSTAIVTTLSGYQSK